MGELLRARRHLEVCQRRTTQPLPANLAHAGLRAWRIPCYLMIMSVSAGILTVPDCSLRP